MLMNTPNLDYCIDNRMLCIINVRQQQIVSTRNFSHINEFLSSLPKGEEALDSFLEHWYGVLSKIQGKWRQHDSTK